MDFNQPVNKNHPHLLIDMRLTRHIIKYPMLFLCKFVELVYLLHIFDHGQLVISICSINVHYLLSRFSCNPTSQLAASSKNRSKAMDSFLFVVFVPLLLIEFFVVSCFFFLIFRANYDDSFQV
uniref:Uncharacterized protein n=1 Tax=Opuntia streptacantha TaxID=393608 RepID=A0A7C9AK61_OPUST